MKSNIYFQGGQKLQDDLHAVIVDNRGYAARVLLKDLPDGILRACDGLLIEETGFVVKPCRHFGFPQSGFYKVTDAHPLYARLRMNYERIGVDALVFRIGLQAPNGFSIPSHDVVDKVYVVDPTYGA